MTSASTLDDNAIYVGFDVDDVLLGLRELLSEGMSRRVGKRVDWRDWSSYSFYEGVMSKHEFVQMIIDDRMLERCEPDDGATEAIARLKGEGLKSALITARGFHPLAREITIECFRRHELHFDHLHVVEHGTGKAAPALGIPNMIAYVDDHAAHLDDIAAAFTQAGREIHLSVLSRPWNVHNNRHHRIESVDQFVDVVLERHLAQRSSDGPGYLSRPKR